MYTLYILYSERLGRYYVGFTNDLLRRLTEHNREKGKYTDKGIPWYVVYTEEFDEKLSAMARERYIKSQKSRTFIERLVKGGGQPSVEHPDFIGRVLGSNPS